MNEPNLVDYLTLGAAVIAALTVPAIEIWKTLRGEREFLDLHIDWTTNSGHRDYEAVFVYVHNKSKAPIAINDMYYLTGAFFRKRQEGTALYYENPEDVDFPYKIAPGAIDSFRIDEDQNERIYDKIKPISKHMGNLKRSAIWITVETMGGTKRTIGTETAIPWNRRPQWTKISQ